MKTFEQLNRKADRDPGNNYLLSQIKHVTEYIELLGF